MYDQYSTEHATCVKISANVKHRKSESNVVESSVTKPRRSRPWRGRATGDFASNGRTVVPNHLIDHCEDLKRRQKHTLTVILTHAHNKTFSLQMGPARLAYWLGCSDVTAKRALAELVELEYLRKYQVKHGSRFDESMYVVNLYPNREAEMAAPEPAEMPEISEVQNAPPSPPEASQEVHNLVQTEVKNDPTPPVKNDPTLSIKNLELITEEEKDTAPLRFACVLKSSNQVREPQRAPSTGMGLNAFQLAALEVMLLLDVVDCPENRKLRDGIASAIALHVNRREEHAKRAVEEMVLCWRMYQDNHPYLRCPLGMLSFFVSGTWCNAKSWRYDAGVLDRVRRYPN